jgi:hypothetical protein
MTSSTITLIMHPVADNSPVVVPGRNDSYLQLRPQHLHRSRLEWARAGVPRRRQDSTDALRNALLGEVVL